MIGWIAKTFGGLVLRFPWLGKAAGFFSAGRLMIIAGIAVAAFVGKLMIEKRILESDLRAAQADKALIEGSLTTCRQSNIGLSDQIDRYNLQAQLDAERAAEQARRAADAEREARAADARYQALLDEQFLNIDRSIADDPSCAAQAAELLCAGFVDQLRSE